MGAAISTPDDSSNLSQTLDKYGFIQRFNNLVDFIRANHLSNTLINEYLSQLSDITKEFFLYFQVCVLRRTLNCNIDPYFNKIEEATTAFQNCAHYIVENIGIEETNAILRLFQNDLTRLIKQLFTFEQNTITIVKNLQNGSSPQLMKRFYLELAFFDLVLNVKILEVPPYYQMSTLPIYSIHNDFKNPLDNRINVISSHQTGKTTLVPMFLACNMLSQKSISSKRHSFIIVVENDPTLIHHISDCYKRMNIDRSISDVDYGDGIFGTVDDNEEEDNDDEDFLIITTSYQKVLELAQKSSIFSSVVAILSPVQVLQLMSNNSDEQFYNRAVFVLDDVTQRSIEMDVLIQNISRKVLGDQKKSQYGKMVCLSLITDNSINNAIRFSKICHYEPKKQPGLKRRIIECEGHGHIVKNYMIPTMLKFFNNWIKDKVYEIGSVIVFVPKSRSALQIIKSITKYYSKENSINFVVLQAKIRKGESVLNFNERLLREIELAAAERGSEDDTSNILFILPINLTGNITEEEKRYVESPLPLAFLKRNVVRIVFTTDKNEGLISIPDVTVVFDSGLTENEYYNIDQAISYYKEDLLPESIIDQHDELISIENSIHFIFNDKNTARPKTLSPPIQRCDMTHAILSLKSINIDLDRQANLPNEPNRQILDAGITLLINLGILNEFSKQLTPIGQSVVKFSSVSPYFALATANYTQNHEFAFLVSLIIERFTDLIHNDMAELMYSNFCPESDIVTLLHCIFDLNTNGDDIIRENDIDYERSGLSIGTLYSIYLSMANTFNKKTYNEGRELVVNSIKWARNQPGGTLSMADNFINLLNKEKFLNLRKATFQYVAGAGPGCEPILVYKAHDIFKFNPEKDAEIKYSHRPGWLGLQSPGDIIVLSVHIEESSHINRGIVMHRDPSQIGVHPGVVSQEESNPSLNSYFFTALFEAYWSGLPMKENFISIYHSNKPLDEASFLINICESSNKTFLNYCPKTADVKNQMNAVIPLLSSLLPYVPRSIIAKSDTPPCVVEIYSYGASRNYDSKLYQVDNPSKPKPTPYPVNKAVLDFAGTKINHLRATFPTMRFAITGESVCYTFSNHQQKEIDFSYPNPYPKIKSVFDPSCASHLVFLVDNDDKPTGVDPLQWYAATDSSIGTVESNDSQEIELLANASSKILNGLGYATQSNDLFYITLNNGFPSVGEGEIPDFIQAKVGYCAAEQNAIKLGVDQLVSQFTHYISPHPAMEEPIPLMTLSSTNHCTNYSTPALQENVLNQIMARISTRLGIPVAEIESLFLGPSMIALSMPKLPGNLTNHPKSIDLRNNDYQACEADKIIQNELAAISVPVTKIVHEPTIEMEIYHLRRLRLTPEAFQDNVKNIYDKFGFLKYLVPEYTEVDDAHHKVIGKMSLGLIGKSACFSLATCITKAFPIVNDAENEFFISRTMTMTMATMATMKARHDLDPRVKCYDKFVPIDKTIMHVPDAEIDAMRALVKHNTNLKLDDKSRVLIYPTDDSENVRKLLCEIRKERVKAVCFLDCELEEAIFLPQCIYVNEKNGSITPLGICKECALSLFQYDPNLAEIFATIYNPITQLIDQSNLKKIDKFLTGFTLVNDDIDEKNEYWPQLPLGQLVWALMSDPDGDIQPYIRAWFTIVIEYTIRNTNNYIFCPRHPEVALPLPEAHKKVKCPYCDQIFCDTCIGWHSLDDPCGVPDPTIKRCPWCNMPGVKVSGCNRITCPKCGKHWCYQCCRGFLTANDCYAHMAAENHNS